MNGRDPWRIYSADHLRELAEAVGSPAKAFQEGDVPEQLEWAGTKYRLSSAEPDLAPSSEAITDLTQLHKNLVRLRKVMDREWTSIGYRGQSSAHWRDRAFAILNVRPEDVQDGVPQRALTRALEREQDPDERVVLDLLAELAGDLAAEPAFEAVEELARRAEAGIKLLEKVRGLTARRGRTGNIALRQWIGSVLRIYKEVTGRKIAVSKDAMSGKPIGPLLRFLTVAGKPVGIVRTGRQWTGDIEYSCRYTSDAQNN